MLFSISNRNKIRRIFKDYKEDITAKEVRSPFNYYISSSSPVDCHLLQRHAATLLLSPSSMDNWNLNNSRYNGTVNSWVQILLVKVTIPLIWVSWRKWSVKSPLWRPNSEFHKVRHSTILKYETTEDYNYDWLLLKIQDIHFSGLVVAYLFR